MQFSALMLICAATVAMTKPIMFDTRQADAVLTSLEAFPPDNPWHRVVSNWPVHPNSKNIITSIGPAKPVRYNLDMAFILVPPDQSRVDVNTRYAAESDQRTPDVNAELRRVKGADFEVVSAPKN